MSDETHPESRPVSHQYVLAVLGEECGEVIQIVGKTLRFGYESYSPEDKKRETNLDLLHKELGDVLAAIDFAVERGLLDREKLVTRQFHKRRHLLQVAPPNTYSALNTTNQPAPVVYYQSTPTGDIAVSQLSASAPDMAPAPEPQIKTPANPKRAYASLIAFGLGLTLLIYLVLTLTSQPAVDRLDALKKFDECLIANKGNETSCNELAKAAGEDPMTPSLAANVVAPVEAPTESADSVVAGSK